MVCCAVGGSGRSGWQWESVSGPWLGGLRGHSPSSPEKSHPLVSLTLQLSTQFNYSTWFLPGNILLLGMSLTTTLSVRRRKDSGLLGGMGSSKSALLDRSYTDQPPKLKGLNREASLSSLDSLRLWRRNNFTIAMFRKGFHKVNGFWCKMGLVSIKSQSGVYWDLCAARKTDWLLHLADICQLFSNRTVLQLLGM